MKVVTQILLGQSDRTQNSEAILDSQTPATLTEAFSRQVLRAPEQVAVVDEVRQLSYSQLDQLANTIAARFPEEARFIGVVMDHSVEMIATLLAVLKFGAAYVPAEPSFPIERIRFMMTQSGVSFVVTQEQYVSVFEDVPLVLVEKGMEIDTSALEPSEVVLPQSLAYVLYTSGTTGYPKGVAVEHRNVCHYTRAFCTEFTPTDADVMLQNSVCTFDIFVEEVFPILFSGGSLAIPNAFTRSDFSSLMDFVEDKEVSIISGFPYLLWELNKLESIPERLRLLISGGDVLKADYVSNLLDKVDVYNTYGPTETTVCATYFKCNGYEPLSDGTFPVGKPVAGATVCLLDESLLSVQNGEIGEICICGDGVARGYLESGKNQEAFVQLEFGRRFYRSGDLGCMLPDGNIHFLKRNDEQVMISGKRVEPQEIELVLERNELIEHAVVTTGVDEAGFAYISAYIVPSSRDISVSHLRSYLSEHVPDYMVPEYFIMLRELPLTPNGKVDRRTLPIVLKGGSRL